MVKRRSFTIKASGILRQLVTPCFVSVATKLSGAADRPAQCQYSSIWDTGATFSMVSKRVVAELGLQEEGYANIHHAGGEAHHVPIYHVDLLLFNNVQVANARVGLVLAKNVEVIIGMDIINRGDFAISNRNGATTFSFRIPSVESFDFAAEDNLQGSGVRSGNGGHETR